jgi:putative aldouronate transport system substrate-binding protein
MGTTTMNPRRGWRDWHRALTVAALVAGFAWQLAAQAVTSLTIILPGDRPLEMDKVAAAIENAVAKDLGPVKLDFQFFPFDQFNQKVALKAAAREPMDLVFDPAWLNFYQMQAQGAFLPLDSLISKLSYYGKAGNIPSAVWKAVSVKGKVYGLPALENNYVDRAESSRNIIRKDLYEKYAPKGGIKTGPQLLEFIKAVKKNEPQYLMLNTDDNKLSTPAAALMGTQGTWDMPWVDTNIDDGDIFVDASKTWDASHPPKVFSIAFTDQYKNEVAAAIALQKLGLITNEAISDKRQSFIAGHLGMFGGDKDDYSQSAYPAVKDSFGCVWVRTDVKAKGVLERAAGNWFCVGANCKAPLVAAGLVNWIMSSRDNYELWAYGIKGDHFKVNDQGAIEKIDPDKKRYEMLWWYVFNRNDLRQNFSGTPDALAYLKWANVDANSYANPLIGFPFDPEPVKTEIASLRTVVSEYKVLGLGLSDAGRIKDYQAKLNAAGLQKVIDETNRQIAVWWATR